MKKLVIIIALVLGMSTLTFAQGSLFRRGSEPEGDHQGPLKSNGMPLLPSEHNQNGNQDADVPLGGGTLVMVALGAGYAVVRRKKSE